jgi:hypothetical protein
MVIYMIFSSLFSGHFATFERRAFSAVARLLARRLAPLECCFDNYSAPANISFPVFWDGGRARAYLRACAMLIYA